jgi:LemA protein
MKRIIAMLSIVLSAFALTGCGYNDIQKADEAVNSAHAQVLSVYKKRADLIPNLVEVVKGYAAHEKEVFISVADARSRAGQVVLPANATPEEQQRFVEAQKNLGGALTRLLAVAENYPQLKANESFRDLQRQLTEMENQSTAVRNKYIRSIQTYNTLVRQFPVNLTASVFGFKSKQQMQFEDEAVIKKTPQVKF